MRALLLSAAGVAAVIATVSATQPDRPPLRVVAEVDYARYAGRWYEIARLPNRFEKNCLGNITATYAMRPDGRIDVTNRCLEEGGRVNVAKGIARRAKGEPPSVLEVRFAPRWLSFLPMVWGDYRIIALAPDYTHTLIGSSNREYLWVLARSPRLDPAVYRTLLDAAKAQGFETSRMIEVRHELRE